MTTKEQIILTETLNNLEELIKEYPELMEDISLESIERARRNLMITTVEQADIHRQNDYVYGEDF